MTREQAKQNLIGFGVSEPTDEQISSYLNQIGAETKSYKDKLATAEDKDTRIAELEKELEKINNQNMSDVEIANAERDKALSSVEELKKQIKSMQTKTSLAEIGITGEIAEKLINPDGVIDFATLGQIISDREKAAAELKEKALLDNTPNPNGGASGKGKVEKTEAEKIAESLGKVASATNKSSESIIDSYKS